MNKNKKEIGATIKQIRKEKGISQDTLSKKMGFKDHTALTKIETGVNDVNSETLIELARLLDVHVGVFFTGKTNQLSEFKIKQYEESYYGDMIFMVLSVQNELKKIPSINYDLLNVKTKYLDNGDMFWVALDENNRVIGCLGYETIKPLEARICHMYIKHEFKRQGIGKALLDTIVKYVKGKRYNKLSVSTLDDKYWESKTFFKENGFVETEHNILEMDI